MDKIILEKVNIRSFTHGTRLKAAQKKINEYITENDLDVISVSLFKENDDEYLFTLTVR